MARVLGPARLLERAVRSLSVPSPFARLAVLIVASALPAATHVRRIRAADCNANGTPDDLDVRAKELSLDAPRLFPVGEKPSEVALVDLDGDGDLDLVCALDGRPAVSVVPNDGDGALGSPREYPLPPTTGGSSGLVVRDLDLDGHPDIAAAMPYGNTIQVFANRGDGSFSDPASFPAGTRPYGLAVGRFDGDPYPDLATVASEEKKAAVLFGRGAGAFSTPQRFEAGDSPWKIVAADFDQDGLDDIAVAVGPERLFVLLSRGDGSFKPPVITALIAPLCAIQTADVDGDAAPDLIVSHWDSTDFSISLGNRDGTFRVSTRISIPGNFCEMNISDLDGDGLFDILGAGDTGLAILLGAGDGTFRPPSFVASRFYSGTRLAVGDLTGDRVPDAVFPHRDCCIAVMPGLAGGSLKSLKTIPLYGYSQALAAADFDGDGNSDFAVHAEWPERTTQVFFSKGSQEFEPPVALPMSQSCSRLAAGDATGDGILDIIAAGEQHIQVVPAKAPRGFAAPVHRNLPSTFSSFAIADFDDDGLADAAVSLIGENRILFYRSLGDGSFAPEESIPLSYAPSLQCAADCDRDGILDLVVNDKGRAAILPGWGDGTFDPARERSLAGHSLGPIAVADLDSDGWLDVVGATPDDILVFRGLPGGRFEEPVAWAAPGGTRLLIADLDGDENLDVAVYSARRGGFSVLRGERRGRLSSAESFFTGGILYHTFAAGDFDGNGTVDICGLVPGGETLPSWLAIAFNATPIPSSRDRNGNGVPDECDIRSGSSPDLDGDGVPDETEPDCNRNGRPDDYDIASGAGSDQDEYGVLDECEPDCNQNGIPDDFDISSGSSVDVDRNKVPDACQADCNSNAIPDAYEVRKGIAKDVNGNGIPDDCDFDCNRNGIPDDRELALHESFDRNGNSRPDECDIAEGSSQDVDGNGIPDEAEADCDRNGVPDPYEIQSGVVQDLNRNGVPDPCDIASGASKDVDADGVPDEAQPDCDGDGVPDAYAIATGTARDCNRNGIPDRCDVRGAPKPFVTAEDLPVGDWISRVAVADLDRNGLQDLAAVRTKDRVSELKVFLGAPGRRFREPMTRTLNQEGSGPTIADFDRDGILDCITAEGFIVFHRGVGDGTFEEPIETGAFTQSGRAEAFDVDGNGTLDLITYRASEQPIAVYLGLGNGTFEQPIRCGREGLAWPPAAADFDGDGRLDLAFSEPSRHQLSILLGKGNGEFGEPISYSAGGAAYGLVASDVTGDGIPDLVAAEENVRMVEILEGTGQGTFVAGRTIGFDRAPSSVAAGDLDRDGVVDLVVGLPKLGVAVLKGTGAGEFGPPDFYAAGSQCLVLADVDGDGLQDIVGHGAGAISVSYQRPGGSFAAAPSVPNPRSVRGLATGNFDRDAHLDFATSSCGAHGVTVFLGTGDGRAILNHAIPIEESTCSLVAGDYDADGDDDLVASSWYHSKGAFLFRCRGDGTFDAPTVLASDGPALAVALGDLDLDGALDLAVEGDVHGILQGIVFLGNGDGTFRRLGTTYSGGHDRFVLADFNNDRLLDIAAIGAPFVPPPLHILIVTVHRGERQGFD